MQTLSGLATGVLALAKATGLEGVALITAPVGMNLLVPKGDASGCACRADLQGPVPFIAVDVIRLGLLIAFPALVLWLGSLAG